MLHENLKKLRKQKGFTQEELAGQLHVVRQTVSKWEQGLSVPDAQTVSRLAEIYEVPVSDLTCSARLRSRITGRMPSHRNWKRLMARWQAAAGCSELSGISLRSLGFWLWSGGCPALESAL